MNLSTLNFEGEKYIRVEKEDIQTGDLVYITRIENETVEPPQIRKVADLDDHGEADFKGEDVNGYQSVVIGEDRDEYQVFRRVLNLSDGGNVIKEGISTLHEKELVTPQKDSAEVINDALGNPHWTIPVDNIAQDVSDTYTSTTIDENKDFDNVNSPKHYNMFRQEVIDTIEDWTKGYKDPFIGYNVGNVLKYLSRAPYKNNMLEDLNKSLWYLNKAIEYLENTQNND